MNNWSFSAFWLAENAIYQFRFTEVSRKNGEIFKIRRRVLCGSECEPLLVLHK
jgi:hypothetical protein